jgi:hypothetical protein
LSQDLQKLAKRLISLSPQLENEALRKQTRSNLIEVLDDFASLEETIRNSITPPAPPTVTEEKPAPAPAQKSAAPQAPAPRPAAPTAQKPSGNFTSKSEYRPALKNQTLIDALLDYHRRTSPRRSAILRPGEDTTFVTAKVPEVKAELKDERGVGRSAGLAYPILRSRKD